MDGLAQRPPPPDAAGRDRHRQDLHDGLDHRSGTSKPTLVLAHNKTLAAQLYAEFREFFPDNAVEYFVSYFDYYQPEAYLPALGHLHREGLQPERRDRPAPPRRHPRAVRAAGRDHRRVRVVHLRPGRAGGLRRHRPPAAGRRPVPAGRGAAPPRGPPVPAQRRGADPRPVPRPRRHPGDRAGQLGDHRPGRVLRRRGGADHGAGPADRRAAGRAQGAQRLPGHALRDARRTSWARRSPTSRPRWSCGSARWRRRAGRSRRRASASGRRSTSRCCASWATARGVENYSRHLSQREPGSPAVDAAGLLPAGLAAGRGRVAHDDPAGRRHVQERPDPQGDPGRLRLPAAVRAGQPAADVRGVRGARQPGDLRVGDAGPVRAREEPAGRRAADPADRHRRPADHRPPDRGPDRRPARGDPRPRRARRASRWSRR